MNQPKKKGTAFTAPQASNALRWGVALATLCGSMAILLMLVTSPKTTPTPKTRIGKANAADLAEKLDSEKVDAEYSVNEALFAKTVQNEVTNAGESQEGMVLIPGGEFSMGSDLKSESICSLPGLFRDAVPVHRVYVDPFWMDATEVTNEQFAKFADATGYVTVAERKPTAEEFPGAPPENLIAGATVFAATQTQVPLNQHLQWWAYLPGANWRRPLGEKSDITGRETYPVVQIAYADAEAYAKWAGKRLPTEAAWEFAARGGRPGQLYAWGNQLQPDGEFQANIYQGQFPVEGGDTGLDGFKGIAPVAQYAANAYGLYDVAGNVWEWTCDWYRHDYYQTLATAGGVAKNPQGPDVPFDPAEPTQLKRVHRGGSFLCTDLYCTRYMVGARGKGEVSTGSNHVGFRCVKPLSAVNLPSVDK